MADAFPRRRLGPDGLEVSALGIGCLPMSSSSYGPAGGERNARLVVERALELGIDFLDTSDAYGRDFANEVLVGKTIRGLRERLVVGTKFGIIAGEGRIAEVRGDRDYVRGACEGSLQRLGTDHVDVYYQHRVDRDVPIEETVGAMAELVREGKVRYLGLCEASEATIRRAHAVHPISAVQMEYSLWTRDVEGSLLPTLRELGIGLVPYSPLGRGFLTGAVRSAEQLGERDYRRTIPRFSGDNLERNLLLVEELRSLAGEKGATPAQLALAWLLSRGDDIVPIPGMERVELLEQNAQSAHVALTETERVRLDRLFAEDAVAGARFSEEEFSHVDR
jgi:aryl-alcohol dehydrogenase-like predicted oxidoreductase